MRELNIAVCIKQIPDPEATPSDVRVDQEAKRVSVVGLAPVISPFDENALEAALRIKENYGAKITAISVGNKLSSSVLMKALAVGTDDLISAEDGSFEDLDTNSTAYVLSTIIKREKYDLILLGRQAGDWDTGQTGLILAEILKIPSINLVRKIDVEDGKLIVEKVRPDGYELIKVPIPALLAVSNEVGELRYASVKALQAARKKHIKSLNAANLGVDPQKLKKVEIVELYKPFSERKGVFIEGESEEEKGERLAIRLKEDKMI